MKNIIYIILILAYVSCNTELDIAVKDNFDFNITAEKTNINFINKEVKTSLKIAPERIVKGTKYFFSYEIIKGKGFFKLQNKNLNINTEYELSSLESLLIFIGEEITEHEILITIKNDKGLIKEQTLTYKTVDLNDFKVNVTKLTNDEVYFTEDVEFSLEIEKITNELNEELTYELKNTKRSLQGELLINGNELNLDESIVNLSEGKLSALFSSSEIGNLELVFLVKASNGKEYEIQVDFFIKETEIELKITPLEPYNYIGYQTNFNFEILKKGTEELSFELLFNGNKGQLKNGIETYNNGQSFSIDKGAYQMQYTGLESSIHPIQFILKASNGTSKIVDVDFEVKESDFNFIIKPSSNSNFVGEKTRFDIDLTHVGGGNTTYEMYFSGPKSEILYNEVIYKNLDLIPVSIGNSGFEYKGLEISNELINFVVKASNNVVKEQKVNFDSKPTDFVVIPSNDNVSQYFQFDISLNVGIIPPDVVDQFITYKFYFETQDLGDISITEHNTNQVIKAGELLDLGNYRNLRLSLSQSGNVIQRKGKLILFFIDSNNVKKEVPIQVEWTGNN